jgi:hypothetical protein
LALSVATPLTRPGDLDARSNQAPLGIERVIKIEEMI